MPSAAPAELELALGGVTLVGTSVMARVTAFAVPELGAALDLGRLTPTLAAQPVVLLSHAHLDHLSGVLAYLNLRARFQPEPPPRVVVPAAVAAPLRAALAAMPGMEPVRRRLSLEAAVVGVEPGQTVELPGGSATPFAVDHGAAALGWALRRAGGGRPEVVFGGDSTVEPFRADPALLDAAVAVVECSFLEGSHRLAARLSAHAHLADWLELAPRLACDHLVLAHLPAVEPAELVRLTRPLAEALSGELVLWVDAG